MTTTFEAPPLQQASRVSRPVEAHPHSSPSSHTLTPELMAEAAWRLGWLGLVYAGGGVVGHFGRRALLAWTHTADSAFLPADLAALISIAMGIGMFLLSRSAWLSPRRLVDFGLAFEVIGAFGIAVSQYWTTAVLLPDTALTLIPAECVWIVVYPLVVPTAPRKVLIASLLAASMRPAALLLSAAATGADRNGWIVAASYFLPNFAVAVFAYLLARIVHRFTVGLKHAREIGSYELVEPIGEGGMGEVWRARHRLLARPAAIKLIRGDMLGSSSHARDAVVRRFEREAQETARLGSTHTIDVYDFGVTEDGDFYYVMELLDGISLERYVQQFGPMEPPRVAYVLRQVLHSLGEAHARGLVHRDIKPANILICRLGPDDDFVKVLDFGLVKHVETPAATLLTADGSTAGTPAYMAPEIALGERSVDGRADLYSLGCVAYFLLTGRPVFVAPSAMATVLAHVHETPAPPSVHSEFEIPPALEALILECLAKAPAKRPASAEELARALAAAVPQDGWTPDAAHAWWELHHLSMADAQHAAAGPASDAAVAPAKVGRRCWPKFERKPLAPATVASH
jgi:serine/threonine-protein kinase